MTIQLEECISGSGLDRPDTPTVENYDLLRSGIADNEKTTQSACLVFPFREVALVL